MKKLLFIALMSLAGCGHVVTLYPRGGGDQATGTLNDGSRNMSITLKGTTYTGKFVRGQTFGLGMGQSFGGAAPVFGTTMMMGNSNQSSALLVSEDGKSVLKCEITVVVASGGNGVCMDKDGITYDANIKAQ